MIDKIYLLNLDYHIDRLKRIEKQFKYLPLKPTRFKAIDGNKMLNLKPDMDIEEKWNFIKQLNQKLIKENKICNNSKWTFKPGQIGHYFSFYQIFQDAFKNNYQNILILEDDINIKSTFINDFNQAIKNFPKNNNINSNMEQNMDPNMGWDLIYFSLHQIHQKFNGKIKIINQYWGIPIGIKTNNKFNHMLPGTHAILYSKNAIKIILENFIPMCYPTDNFISILIKDNKLKPLYLYGDLITTYHATSSTEFIGGSNYQIIKELGKGYKGIAWLIKQNNQLLVLKRQKILPNELNKDSPIKRELNFFNFINQLPSEEQQYFSKMKSYKTFKCNDFKNYQSDDQRRTQSNLCVDIIMTYQGDSTMNLILSNNFSVNEFKNFIKTLIIIIKILQKYQYSHDDLSYNNISYKIINNQYHYYLIDYGTVFNIKDKAKPKFQTFKEKNIKNNGDFVMVILYLILNDNAIKYAHYKKNLSIHKLQWWEIIILIKNKYPNHFNKILQFFDFSLPNIINQELDFDNDYHIKFKLIISLFSLWYRKEYLLLRGFQFDIPPILNKELIQQIIKNYLHLNKIISLL